MTDDILIRMSKAILATRAPGQSKKAWGLAAARAALAAAKYEDTEEGDAIAVSIVHGVDTITLIECWDALIEEHLAAASPSGAREPLIDMAETAPNTWEVDLAAAQAQEDFLAKVGEISR